MSMGECFFVERNGKMIEIPWRELEARLSNDHLNLMNDVQELAAYYDRNPISSEGPGTQPHQTFREFRTSPATNRMFVFYDSSIQRCQDGSSKYRSIQGGNDFDEERQKNLIIFEPHEFVRVYVEDSKEIFPYSPKGSANVWLRGQVQRLRECPCGSFAFFTKGSCGKDPFKRPAVLKKHISECVSLKDHPLSRLYALELGKGRYGRTVMDFQSYSTEDESLSTGWNYSQPLPIMSSIPSRPRTSNDQKNQPSIPDMSIGQSQSLQYSSFPSPQRCSQLQPQQSREQFFSSNQFSNFNFSFPMSMN